MEYKHIKFKAKLRIDLSRVEVQIIEQTHRGPQFGNRPDHSFRSSDGFALCSAGGPQVGITLVYMRGSCDFADDNVILLRLDVYKRFKQAVEEYNEYFGGGRVKV